MIPIAKQCPQCGSEEIIIDYGPEFNLFKDDHVLIGFLCTDCLHSWARNCKLVPEEDD